jgi:hypothetical protein
MFSGSMWKLVTEGKSEQWEATVVKGRVPNWEGARHAMLHVEEEMK